MRPLPDPAAERRRNAAIASNIRWSRSDGHEGTEAARAAGPGRDDYWDRTVDPDGRLPDAERARRARAAKKAHFLRLAKRSAEVRRARGATS